jgi:hypothetical protein
LNNNRGNNRRRGRGNNNRPQGGGQQLNRIDSRARGNAPQMLEKYRKLAQDAHLNGDRVQAEYYLQFADHYFRVIADTRVRQEEQRQRPNGERWQEPEGEGEDSNEFGMDSDFPGFDRQSQYNREPRDNREQQPRENRDRENREPRDNRDGGEAREQRPPREPRENREPRAQREPRRFERDREPAEQGGQVAVPVDLVPGVEGEPVTEPAADNPFVRDNRASRGLRPRGDRRPRSNEGQHEQERDAPVGLDPSSLPPPIGVRSEPEAPVADQAAEAPAPKKRGRPRKNPAPEAVDG